MAWLHGRPIKEDNKSSEKDMSEHDSGTVSRPIIHWLKPDSKRLMRSAYRRVRGDHSRWTGIIIRQRLAIGETSAGVARQPQMEPGIRLAVECVSRPGKKPFLELVNYVVASRRRVYRFVYRSRRLRYALFAYPRHLPFFLLFLFFFLQRGLLLARSRMILYDTQGNCTLLRPVSSEGFRSQPKLPVAM